MNFKCGLRFMCLFVFWISFNGYANLPTELPPKVHQSDQAFEGFSKAKLSMEWEAVKGASGYQVRLAPLDRKDEILIFTLDENKISREVREGSYKLQVRSRDQTTGYYGPWSQGARIEVSTQSITPLYPENESVLSSPRDRRQIVEFKWAPVKAASVYLLKIWPDDDFEKAKEFRSIQTVKKLNLPAGRSYKWQVTFKNKNKVSYRVSPNVQSFSLLGPQLLTPIIDENLGLPNVKQMNWRRSPGAKNYQVLLQRRSIDDEDWRPIVENNEALDNKVNFAKLSPGVYRMEVSAHAPHRVPSEKAFFEFTVKPTVEDLEKALQSGRPLVSAEQKETQVTK